LSRKKAITLVLCLALLPLATTGCLASGVPCLCTRVIDGDTIVVLLDGKEETVRLLGVDTAESRHPLKPVEYFSPEATAFLSTLVQDKKVWLEYDKQRRGKYGRLLAYVRLPNGTDVNAEIIREGYGFAYLKYPFKRMGEYRELGTRARLEGQGLWADNGMPEIEWIQDRKAEPFKVYATSGGMWAVQYRHWLRTMVSDADLLEVLRNIRRWSAEYSERDLESVLRKNGWLIREDGK
jgi:endonuclease YncB( thermonuclease family)